MISLYELLMICLIVLVVFLIICVYNLIQLIKDCRETIGRNKQQVENILTDVSYLTNETVTAEEKIKGYILELVVQLMSLKSNKEEK